MNSRFIKAISLFILLLSLTSCKKGLRLTTEPIRIPEATKINIGGSDGDIELELGNIDTGGLIGIADEIALDGKPNGIVNVTVKSTNHKTIYFDKNLREAEDGDFSYAGIQYKLKLTKFELHQFHQDIAFVSIEEVK
jgi:hypothetical protein